VLRLREEVVEGFEFAGQHPKKVMRAVRKGKNRGRPKLLPIVVAIPP